MNGSSQPQVSADDNLKAWILMSTWLASNKLQSFDQSCRCKVAWSIISAEYRQFMKHGSSLESVNLFPSVIFPSCYFDDVNAPVRVQQSNVESPVSHGIYTRSKCQTKNRLQGPQEDIKILHGRGFIRANCTLNIDPCEEVGIDVQETEGPYQILIEKDDTIRFETSSMTRGFNVEVVDDRYTVNVDR
eukprot:761205-Hanusia_phi.AAC.6